MLVSVNHAGTVYDIELDETRPGWAFKQTIHERTGIPVDRLKVIVKGGLVKVSRLLSSIQLTHTFPLGFLSL
jgi:ubiquitin carboxyl-terminal hydrolase 14